MQSRHESQELLFKRNNKATARCGAPFDVRTTTDLNAPNPWLVLVIRALQRCEALALCVQPGIRASPAFRGRRMRKKLDTFLCSRRGRIILLAATVAGNHPKARLPTGLTITSLDPLRTSHRSSRSRWQQWSSGDTRPTRCACFPERRYRKIHRFAKFHPSSRLHPSKGVEALRVTGRGSSDARRARSADVVNALRSSRHGRVG